MLEEKGQSSRKLYWGARKKEVRDSIKNGSKSRELKCSCYPVKSLRSVTTRERERDRSVASEARKVHGPLES